MIGSRRRTRSNINVWPGYVDALSALLMLIIFMLLIYVVSQLYLSQTLSDRDSELARLNTQLAEISRLLGLEQEQTAALEEEMATVQSSYSKSLALNDELRAEIEEERAQRLAQQYNAEAQALKVEDLQRAVSGAEAELEDEEKLSASQRAFIQQLSNQIAALQDQLSRITAALRLQEDLTAEKQAELEEVGKRLNTLLAERVNELERYQSEFFGRLREILQDNENIRIVGDRFLLPSELLFASGSASLGEEGQRELDKLAEVLLDVASAIPDDIDWILRIDGHTDRIPINTEEFPSNWELSTARAVAVVRYLASEGVPQTRMVAAGFGEFFPVDEGNSAEALQRNRRIEIKLTDR
ncbi:peptidoglycan -binding protein [Marinobacter panjinensis]|uniref:Peptidoglycan-binding protein n=1 Tax=Marinobacter panjinensis TaxID=2576384 RepID=A0A4U6R351_9GAMM|nr:peptidoglycan -binding protein [Marinobacter panjinensis]MCR8913464.1 peptidoglycan -binding protein [Marinobacter panjinensis]TKV67873.1 peptidoglycan -binding protein [Marinobacter panjinensis]